MRRVLAAWILTAVTLAGCGGGGSTQQDSSTASSPVHSTTSTVASTTTGNHESAPNALGSPRAVRAAVDAVLASSSPAEACGRYVTGHYLSVAYGGRASCVRSQGPGSAATSIGSFRIEQEGTQGTLVVASAVPNGGPYSGTKVRVDLIFDMDHYRVNALHSNVPVGP